MARMRAEYAKRLSEFHMNVSNDEAKSPEQRPVGSKTRDYDPSRAPSTVAFPTSRAASTAFKCCAINPGFTRRWRILFSVKALPVINASASEVLRTCPPPSLIAPSIESEDLVWSMSGHSPRTVIRLTSLSNHESLSLISGTTERTAIFAASIPKRRGTVSVKKMRFTPSDHNFVHEDSVNRP